MDRGGSCSVTVIVGGIGLDHPSKFWARLFAFHFCANALEKGMNPSHQSGRRKDSEF